MKPRLILHVGTPKAGSTALQKSLARRRDWLAERGILYPDHRGVAHHVVSVPLDFEGHAQRGVAQHYGNDADAARADFEAFFARLVTEADRQSAKTVILSSEFLFSRVDVPGFDAFMQRLGAAFRDITIVAYLRQPSAFLASKVAQDVKRSGTLPPLRPYAVRRQIEGWERACPGRVRIFPYDRALLRDGNIAADFFAEVLEQDYPVLTERGAYNTSFSPEASQLLQEFQRETEPHADGILTPEKKRFREAVRRCDAKIPLSQKPALRADLAEYVDTSAVDFLWLRDTHGLAFPKLDYDRMAADIAPPERRFEMVSDYLVVDPERLRKLRRRVLWTYRAIRLLDGLPRPGRARSDARA